MRNVAAVLTTLFALSGACECTWADDRVMMEASGIVADATTGDPIKGALVSAPETNVSSVITNESGRFYFVIPCSEPVAIRIEKDGYKSHTKNVSPRPKVNLSVHLEMMESEPGFGEVSVVSRSHISGSVEGIAQERYGEYKVLVYVLTDKWYRHPFSEETEGRGYAIIRHDGTWRIQTVFRNHQASHVAFLVIDKKTFAPPSVEVFGGDPNGEELRSRIKTVALQVIDAPAGI